MTDSDYTDAQTLAIKQSLAAHFLAFCKKEYDESNQGDRYWVLTAIKVCADSKLPLPEWAAEAYIEGYDIVVRDKAKSWDHAFGHPYPKGTHPNAHKKREKHGLPIWNEINSILVAMPDTPIDEALFEKVGKKYGVGKTRASEYFYFWKKAMATNIIKG